MLVSKTRHHHLRRLYQQAGKNLLLLPFLLTCLTANTQLVLNEFSQGSSGSKEYIELIVKGERTCTDSTADLRGWILDDQNGWYGGLSTAISTGHFRFAIVNAWAAIPYGSILLIYNAADKNTSIRLADDPADVNKDGVYVLPHHSLLFEVHRALPTSPSSASFSYPVAGYGPPAGIDWPLRIGLNNSFDAIILVDPANKSAPSFSLVYGSPVTPPFLLPTVLLPARGGASTSCYLTDRLDTDSNSWVWATVPFGETPGAPNTDSNAAYLQSMRGSPPPLPITFLTACMRKGEIFNFNNQELSTAGNYVSILTGSRGCDSIVHLYLVVSEVNSLLLTGCGPVEFEGTTFITSVILYDTVKSMVSGCDSIVRIVTIKIDAPPVTVTSACLKSGDSLQFNGLWLRASGMYTTTYLRGNQCDSIVRLYLTVSSQVVQRAEGCGSLRHGDSIYRITTVLSDTIKSRITGCDSLYATLNLFVKGKPKVKTIPDTSICTGAQVALWANADSAVVHWQHRAVGTVLRVQPTRTTTYTAIASAPNLCRDTGYVTVTVKAFQLSLRADPDPVTPGQTMLLQTSANQPYKITSWAPASFFSDQHAYSQVLQPVGSFVISVNGVSSQGCTDSASLLVNVQSPQVHVPTAFSPNGDGKNDVLHAVGVGIISLRFLVFNRWGMLVFSTSDAAGGWDGRFQNASQPPGVYVWTLSAVMQDRNTVSQKGTVLLIR